MYCTVRHDSNENSGGTACASDTLFVRDESEHESDVRDHVTWELLLTTTTKECRIQNVRSILKCGIRVSCPQRSVTIDDGPSRCVVVVVVAS